MMKNSPSRIAKRRRSALARRQMNLKTLGVVLNTIQGNEDANVLNRKIEIAKTDIANLERKGIRAS